MYFKQTFIAKKLYYYTENKNIISKDVLKILLKDVRICRFGAQRY